MAATTNNNPSAEVRLAIMCELLETAGVTVRTIQVIYHSIPFCVTYSSLRLTRFAYCNPDPTNHNLHLAKYIAASVTDWSLVESNGVTSLPVTVTSLARLEPALLTAIGKSLSDDYAVVTAAICRGYSAGLSY